MPADTPRPPAYDATSIAARNNADWHAAVFRAHGHACHSADGMWISHAPAPRFFSNAVTIALGPLAAQYAAIDRLIAARRGGFAVKDSFAKLDLSSRGFRVLFDATWIWRDAGLASDAPVLDRVGDPAGLTTWGGALNGPSDGTPAFPTAVFDDPALAFFARWQDGRIVAGAAANRSSDAVGLSNVFAADSGDVAAYAMAVASVAAFAPDLPIVGYEHGDALMRALGLGFTAIGPLRVWARD